LSSLRGGDGGWGGEEAGWGERGEVVRVERFPVFRAVCESLRKGARLTHKFLAAGDAPTCLRVARSGSRSCSAGGRGRLPMEDWKDSPPPRGPHCPPGGPRFSPGPLLEASFSFALPVFSDWSGFLRNTGFGGRTCPGAPALCLPL
jgi:hypothetical protein